MRGALILAGLLASPALAQEDPRLLVLGGSVAEIVAALGEQDRMVGRDTTTTYPPELEALPDVGYVRALSPEGVLSVEPDMILAEAGAGPVETVELLQAAEIPWITIPDAVDGAGVIAKIEAVGAALGIPERAAELSAEVQADLDAAAAAAASVPEEERPRVLFVLSAQGGRIMGGGEGTAAEGIIEMAGGVNALEGVEGYKPLTDEAVTAAAPDVVLMMDRGGDHAMADAELLSLPALATTPAAGTGRVVRLDGLLLLGFGPRTGEAALALHEALFDGAQAGG